MKGTLEARYEIYVDAMISMGLPYVNFAFWAFRIGPLTLTDSHVLTDNENTIPDPDFVQTNETEVRKAVKEIGVPKGFYRYRSTF